MVAVHLVVGCSVILLNFAGNAVKFAETGGVLLLAERACGG